jgi:hypothetical protein
MTQRKSQLDHQAHDVGLIVQLDGKSQVTRKDDGHEIDIVQRETSVSLVHPSVDVPGARPRSDIVFQV